MELKGICEREQNTGRKQNRFFSTQARLKTVNCVQDKTLAGGFLLVFHAFRFYILLNLTSVAHCKRKQLFIFLLELN